MLEAEGHCYTFGNNQFGQLGNQVSNSRQPQEVRIAQTQKVAMVACGDTFTVVVADGKGKLKY
jgi:alpha-tubulin suppressor-like RCC1 family protein